jgi:ribosome biogenesis GTPase
MRLERYGYDARIEASRRERGLRDTGIGRVVAEHRERYVVATESGDVEAEVSGILRHRAAGREDFPAVGDWVALDENDSGTSIVHAILPRSSVISRQAVGSFGEVQIIAANVDSALLVQALDRDFNLSRLERYLAICHSSGVDPVVVLTKTDLMDPAGVADAVDRVARRVGHVPVVAVSDRGREGYGALDAMLVPGRTYCLLGSSGVGKSTLTNHLGGAELMRTDSISASTGKGRHVTSHRSLVVLENGALLVDNPGMREVGVVDEGAGLEATFDRLLSSSGACRFRDCTHTVEAGCAVLDALRRGDLAEESYGNWLKMEKEKAHFGATTAERRKKDRAFGKMLDVYKKEAARRKP